MLYIFLEFDFTCAFYLWFICQVFDIVPGIFSWITYTYSYEFTGPKRITKTPNSVNPIDNYILQEYLKGFLCRSTEDLENGQFDVFSNETWNTYLNSSKVTGPKRY